MDIATEHGLARVVIEGPDGAGGVTELDDLAAFTPAERNLAGPAFLVALTHGAGGGTDSADLLAVRDAVARLGGVTARITQPYRVRGARAPGSVPKQDEAWIQVIAALRAAAGLGCPLVVGGRSNGARVACRTAAAVDAQAVIALAFPLHPPGHPDRSRAGELRAAGRKVLVVNGDRDPFGVPGRMTGVRVVVLPGETHALTRRPAAVGAAVTAWLPRVLGLPRPAAAKRRRAAAVGRTG